MIIRMCIVNGKCIFLNEVSLCEMVGYIEYVFFLVDWFVIII